MLTAACHAFRVAFSPQDEASAGAPHRAQCAACDAYAQHLEDAAVAPASPLSSKLRARLSVIPQLSLGCEDIDTLYGVTRQRAQSTWSEATSANTASADTSSADAHLLACRRCRDLYGCVHDAMTQERRALPAPLFERLRQIARHPVPRLPIWVLDGRYATAVCYLLTAFLVLLAGDASARFQVTTEVVSARAGSWLDDRLDDGSRWLGSLEMQLQRGLEDSRSWLLDRQGILRQSADRGADRLQDRLRSLNFDPRRWLDGEDTPDPQPTEGDSDDRTN